MPNPPGRRTGVPEDAPEFESTPAKTAMDAIKALLWIPDTAAKIILLAAVVLLGWKVWGNHARLLTLESRVIAAEGQIAKVSQQREVEMALLTEAISEIKLYRQAVIAKSGKILNPDDGGSR